MDLKRVNQAIVVVVVAAILFGSGLKSLGVRLKRNAVLNNWRVEQNFGCWVQKISVISLLWYLNSAMLSLINMGDALRMSTSPVFQIYKEAGYRNLAR